MMYGKLTQDEYTEMLVALLNIPERTNESNLLRESGECGGRSFSDTKSDIERAANDSTGDMSDNKKGVQAG